jgi:hypothetical protein
MPMFRAFLEDGKHYNHLGPDKSRPDVEVGAKEAQAHKMHDLSSPSATDLPLTPPDESSGEHPRSGLARFHASKPQRGRRQIILEYHFVSLPSSPHIVRAKQRVIQRLQSRCL